MKMSKLKTYLILAGLLCLPLASIAGNPGGSYEPASKHDVQLVKSELQGEIKSVKVELDGVNTRIDDLYTLIGWLIAGLGLGFTIILWGFGWLRSDMKAMDARNRADMHAMETRIMDAIQNKNIAGSKEL